MSVYTYICMHECMCNLMENNSSQRGAHVASNHDYSASTKLKKCLYINIYIHTYILYIMVWFTMLYMDKYLIRQFMWFCMIAIVDSNSAQNAQKQKLVLFAIAVLINFINVLMHIKQSFTL